MAEMDQSKFDVILKEIIGYCDLMKMLALDIEMLTLPMKVWITV
jgi:hypothetical protein